MNPLETLTPASVVPSVCAAAAISAGLIVAYHELRWLHASGRLDRAALREMLLSVSPLPVNALAMATLGAWWTTLYVEAFASAPRALPVTPLTVVAAFFAVDSSYYWEHRAAHAFAPLWRIHAVHHSSERLTIATGYRVSILNKFASPIFFLPWLLLGFPPFLIIGWQLFCYYYQIWVHTELIGSLGFVDRFLNTPSNHRVHHSAALEHQGRNLGAALIVWDRLFGTYTPEPRTLRYGIPGARPPRGPWRLYADPWRRDVSAPVGAFKPARR